MFWGGSCSRVRVSPQVSCSCKSLRLGLVEKVCAVILPGILREDQWHFNHLSRVAEYGTQFWVGCVVKALMTIRMSLQITTTRGKYWPSFLSSGPPKLLCYFPVQFHPWMEPGISWPLSFSSRSLDDVSPKTQGIQFRTSGLSMAREKAVT